MNLPHRSATKSAGFFLQALPPLLRLPTQDLDLESCFMQRSSGPRTKLVFGGVLLLWAAGLQVHMWHMQKQPEFQTVFGPDTTEPKGSGSTQWWRISGMNKGPGDQREGNERSSK